MKTNGGGEREREEVEGERMRREGKEDGEKWERWMERGEKQKKTFSVKKFANTLKPGYWLNQNILTFNLILHIFILLVSPSSLSVSV